MSTRAEIRELARIRADQTNSTFPTDAECNTIINTVVRRVWRKLYKAGWKPAVDEASITATGAAFYLLANNLLSVLDVYRVDGTNRTSLPRIKPEDRATWVSRGTGPAEAYDLRFGVVKADGNTGLQLQLYPRPTSGTYEVYAVETFDGLDDDAQTWTGPPGSDELIAVMSAIEMLTKEGDVETARVLKEEAAELYNEVCEMGGWIDAKYQPTVRDTRNLSSVRYSYDWAAQEGWL